MRSYISLLIVLCICNYFTIALTSYTVIAFLKSLIYSVIYAVCWLFIWSKHIFVIFYFNYCKHIVTRFWTRVCVNKHQLLLLLLERRLPKAEKYMEDTTTSIKRVIIGLRWNETAEPRRPASPQTMKGESRKPIKRGPFVKRRTSRRATTYTIVFEKSQLASSWTIY